MTKKFGIIGNPIKHSLSPVLHNYWFNKYKIDANYSIIDIEESEIPKIIKKSAILIGPRRLLIMLATPTLLLSSITLPGINKIKITIPLKSGFSQRPVKIIKAEAVIIKYLLSSHGIYGDKPSILPKTSNEHK